MIKFITNKEYEHLERINTLPFRSHYIPFGKDCKPKYKFGIIDKYSSNEVISLNGDWFFKAHDSIESCKEVDETLPDKIDVPSCVQCRGYDYYQYTNFEYPFPFNPPFIDQKNPLFHYRKIVNLDSIQNEFLVFEGVDSSFYLYVNNQYVGYSQVTHSKSEFDITKYLVKGENLIDVLVLKWCASSYVEDQDKFRFTGIFRDVYLLNRPNNYIFDYKIEPIHEGNKWFVLVTNLSKSDFKVSFQKSEYEVKKNESKKIEVNKPVLWNCENPYLYKITIFNDCEFIYESIGLREVTIKNSIFYLNGVKRKLKGVNRHESNPVNGATVTIKDTLKDLKLIKSIYANAIRTSHYPDIPEFYELCDLLGIYVLNEADVESHGAVGPKYELQPWQDFTNSGIFDHTITDREISLYERDKNRTCVIIWSLGNESNWGKMFYDGADYIHAHDNRPIHYEGIFNLVDKSDYYTTRIDICSRMYPSIEDLKENYLKDPREKRPLCLCEYTHAMGNSCGDVKDYWDLINKEDRIIGAFVWEWCDHAVTVNGELKYGADFPEHHHDGNFCVDGLVSPYREFKSSTYEVKALYNPKFRESTEIFKPKKVNYKNCEDYFKINENGGVFAGIFAESLTTHITRANIDNEMHDWEQIGKARNAKIVTSKLSENTFQVDYFDGDKKFLTITNRYSVKGNILEINSSYEKLDDFYVQRVGFSFAIPDLIKSYNYFGYGPFESYIDKHFASKINKYKVKISEIDMPYLKPQDFNLRYFCSVFSTKYLEITAKKPFSFSVMPYSEKHILETKHDYELSKDGKLYINFDIATAGVGTHACGPVLDKKYQVPSKGENTFFIVLKK